jgi:hypothetical protein
MRNPPPFPGGKTTAARRTIVLIGRRELDGIDDQHFDRRLARLERHPELIL